MVRGQLKIQQMAFMLLAVTLFFVFAGMFVLIIKMSELKETATNLEEQGTRLLISKLANSPEFACGTSMDESRINCVDADKVMALKNNIEKYKNFWGKRAIEIRKVHPVGAEKECVNRDFADCNLIRVTEKREGNYDSNFVSLCWREKDDMVYDKCVIANLLVSSSKK